MRQLAILGTVILGLSITYFTDLGEALVFFVLTGYIPILNVSVHPVAMLVFWILIIPTLLIVYRFSSYSFWGVLEIIGKVHQRHLNRTIRWPSDHIRLRPEQFIPLAAIVMLHHMSKLPDSSTSIPALTFRRRFLSVPTA